jgi:hypothetical protein
MTQKHALVIGGTGMLADVSLWLVDAGYKVSVIGRDLNKHRKLVDRAIDPSLINPLPLDYNNEALFEDKVRQAILQHGQISLVVSWPSSSNLLEIISNLVSKQNGKWKLYQIKGSRKYFHDEVFTPSSNCDTRSIYLGFIMQDNQSRWLTNSEIAQGIIKNMKEDKTKSIVGILHPYEKRPCY